MPETSRGGRAAARSAFALPTLLLLAAALVVGPGPGARAQTGTQTLAKPLDGLVNDRPILVNRLTADVGFVFDAEDRGSQGVVYRLTRQTRAGEQVLQIAYGGDGTPRIARLSQRLTGNATVNRLALTKAVDRLAATVRPGWEAGDAIADGLRDILADHEAADEPSTDTITTDAPESPVVVRLYPEQGAAVVDIRPDAPQPRVLPADEVEAALRDTTARIVRRDGATFTAYHAPDGLLSRRPAGESALDTGTWRVAPSGAYCVETAPRAGWRCRYVVAADGGGYALMRAQDGRATGELTADMTLTPGNAAGLFVARVRDILAPEMVMTLTAGHTAVHRDGGEDAPAAVYYRERGQYTARRDGRLESGIWNVLQDGRRCRQRKQPTPGGWDCAYLRETDGGTFALVDESGAKTGEVVISEGNTEGL